MPEFISKLQHYISEQGEFTDEKARGLDQTLELIKNFPWDVERPYASADLTGPSVTIEDESGNYLKIGLGADSLLRVNYLDAGGHLYDYGVDKLETAILELKSFFIGTVDLGKYHKHLLSVGHRADFISQNFVYKANLWETVSSCFSIPIFLFLPVFMWVKSSPDAPNSERILFISVALFLTAILVYIFTRYFSYMHKSLQITRGNDTFYFNDGLSTTKYDKNNINQIVVYTTGSGTRKPLYFYVYEIQFNDGTSLRFSNMLISNGNFKRKFPDDIFTYSDKWAFWKL